MSISVITGPARWTPDAKIQMMMESATGYMRILLRIFPLILILFGATLLFEQTAHAYADPGTGLLAVQAAGSALVATGWYLRRKIYALFQQSTPKAEPEKLLDGRNVEDSRHP
jgi:hypothetical protein